MGKRNKWTGGLFSKIWMNTFHKHYADGLLWRDFGFEVPPHEEAANRQGSNCAGATLEENYRFYVLEWGAEFEVETNHSRNGDGLSRVDKIAQMAFEHMMRRPDWWHHAGVTYGGYAFRMPQSYKDKIMAYSHQAAIDMMGYGDERIEGNWQNIAQMRQRFPQTSFYTGMELNLRADFSVDTTLWSDPRCQLVVLSLHPDVDQAFKDQGLNRDPHKHSMFMAKALVDHQQITDIWAHPGYSCKPLDHTEAEGDGETAFRRQMDWDILAPILLRQNIALEINWSRVYQWACRNLHKLEDQDWQKQALAKFEETPFLNDPETMGQLKEYLKRGLLIAINNDSHYVPLPQARGKFNELIKLYGQWMDQRLIRYHIQPTQVINTWPKDIIEDWLNI